MSRESGASFLVLLAESKETGCTRIGKSALAALKSNVIISAVSQESVRERPTAGAHAEANGRWAFVINRKSAIV